MLVMLLHSLLPQAAWSEEVEWTRVFGTAGGDSAIAVSADASGVYVAGIVGGVLPGQVGAGGADAFLRKYDHDGNELWTRQFGGPQTDYGLAVHAVDGAVYVAGSILNSAASRGDGYLRKHDADGNLIWIRIIAVASSSVGPRSLSSDASGVYLAGTVHLNIFISVSVSDIDGIVRKYDHDGNLLWARTIEGSPDVAGGINADWATGISVHASGAYVSGWTATTLPGQTKVGGVDPYVRKYDADGNEIWTRQFGTVTTDEAFGVASDDSGVYVGGYTGGAFPGFTDEGGIDGFLRKYDHDGNELWTQQFGSPIASLETFGVAVDASGVYAGGLLSPTFGFARKFNHDGVMQWSQVAIGVVRAVSAAGGAVYISGNEVSSGNAFLTKIGQGSNQPPVADAGEDQIVEATSPAGADVTLDGTGSSDPDNNSLTYAWSGAFGASTEASPTISLPLGVHVITLVVDNGSGSPASDTVTITVQDTTPPETTITTQPAALSNAASPSFSFEGLDIVSVPELLTFECSLDGAPWAACTSPHTYSSIAEGAHEFQVRAKDESGNTDPTPATFMWTVDTTPPSIVIHLPAQGASFTMGSSHSASYSCSDSGSGISTCAGTLPDGATLSTTTVGSYSFTVDATDLAGNQASITHDYSVSYGVCGYEQFAARRAGSVIPVKVFVCNSGGSNLSAQSIVATATGVMKVSDSASAPLADAGHANPDFNFRFDTSLFDGTGGYIFNLDTNGFTTGTYRLFFKVSGDPGTHHVEFQIR